MDDFDERVLDSITTVVDVTKTETTSALHHDGQSRSAQHHDAANAAGSSSVGHSDSVVPVAADSGVRGPSYVRGVPAQVHTEKHESFHPSTPSPKKDPASSSLSPASLRAVRAVWASANATQRSKLVAKLEKEEIQNRHRAPKNTVKRGVGGDDSESEDNLNGDSGQYCDGDGNENICSADPKSVSESDVAVPVDGSSVADCSTNLRRRARTPTHRHRHWHDGGVSTGFNDLNWKPGTLLLAIALIVSVVMGLVAYQTVLLLHGESTSQLKSSYRPQAGS